MKNTKSVCLLLICYKLVIQCDTSKAHPARNMITSLHSISLRL